MKVHSLTVEQRPSYDADYPNQLVGLVQLKGPSGTQEVRLSNAGLSKIFAVIADEVVSTARSNAEQVARGMSDAVNEPLMLSAQKIETIPF